MLVVIPTTRSHTIAHSIFLVALFFLSVFSSDIMGAPKLWHGRVHRSLSVAGYEDLQSIYNSDGRVEKGESNKPVLTKTNAQFDACKHLFAMLTRFRDAVAVMSIVSTQTLAATRSRRMQGK